MKGTKVASRYAKALLDLSIEQNSLDKINEDMNSLATLTRSSADLENLLTSPIVDRKKKADILNKLFEGKMEKMSLNFIQLITKNGREGILPAIADSFVQQYKDHKGIVDVYITSAQPLEKTTREKILTKVGDLVKGTLVTHETVDASLIGGFTVRIQDKQMDASIASQLRNLKNILLN